MRPSTARPAMAAEGAAIITSAENRLDPARSAVEESVETERVVPIIERIARTLDVTISIDTSKPGVMARPLRRATSSTMCMRCGHPVPANGPPGREWECA